MTERIQTCEICDKQIIHIYDDNLITTIGYARPHFVCDACWKLIDLEELRMMMTINEALNNK